MSEGEFDVSETPERIGLRMTPCRGAPPSIAALKGLTGEDSQGFSVDAHVEDFFNEPRAKGAPSTRTVQVDSDGAIQARVIHEAAAAAAEGSARPAFPEPAEVPQENPATKPVGTAASAGASPGGEAGTAASGSKGDARAKLQARMKAGTAYPRVGEEIGGFKLLAPLGRGALGRVFLASQPALADRPVVLKITPLVGSEHHSLARLQHTHIVPLLSVQDVVERGMRMLCLSYHGGATLEDIQIELGDKAPAKRTGRDILSALDRAGRNAPLAPPAEGPARAFLAGETYERSICWIVSCLADALTHAHRRGLVHLDVKPANVLIAVDGMPLLLDFHLARGVIGVGTPEAGFLGGTPGYMAPEQKAAVDAVREKKPVATPVDARADVYGLGVLLFEALTGERPEEGKCSARDLRRRNPAVSVGLADVTACCLAVEPSRRYPDVSSLADDLRRHLDDRPLRGVANRSVRERWGRWRRGRPLALAKAGALAAAALGTSVAGLSVWLAAESRRADAEQELEQARRHLAAGAYTEAFRSLEHGRALLRPGPVPERWTPGVRELRKSLAETLDRATRAKLKGDLHTLADQVRFLYSSGTPTGGKGRNLERELAEVWQSRREIAKRLDAGGDGRAAEQVKADLLDLAILWSDLRVGMAGKSGREQARREALRTLAEAEAEYGRSPVLEVEKRIHSGADVRDVVLEKSGPISAASDAKTTAWECYALGRALLRAGDLERASLELERASELVPQSLWVQFYRGQCALRRGRPVEAVEAFGASVALAPDAAGCYYNRGLAYARLGEPGRARRDVERAMKLDRSLPDPGPGFGVVARNGGGR